MKPKIHSLHEAAATSGLDVEILKRFIILAWIHPVNLENSGESAHFSELESCSSHWTDCGLDQEDIARARLISDLKFIFDVNDSAVPIILDLVDQLNRMHLELKNNESNYKE